MGDNDDLKFKEKYEKYKLKYLSLKGGAKVEVPQNYDWKTYRPFKKIIEKRKNTLPYLIYEPIDLFMISPGIPIIKNYIDFFHKFYSDGIEYSDFKIIFESFLSQYGITWQHNPFKLFKDDSTSIRNITSLNELVRIYIEDEKQKEKTSKISKKIEPAQLNEPSQLKESEQKEKPSKISKKIEPAQLNEPAQLKESEQLKEPAQLKKSPKLYITPSFFTKNKLKPASVNDIEKYRNFYGNETPDKFSRSYWIDDRIDKLSIPLNPNYIYFGIDGINFFVTFLCYGDNRDENIIRAINYKTEKINKKKTLFPHLIDYFDDEIKKINENGYKFFRSGFMSGKISDKHNILIEYFNSEYMPRGYGNYMLCLFINYLKNYHRSYNKDTNFNIELLTEETKNIPAYINMGFDNYRDRPHELYYKNNKSNMKIVPELFTNICHEKFGEFGDILFFENNK